MTELNYLILIILWITYFLIHSALATLQMKELISRNFPSMKQHYRLTYNLIAILLLAPPLYYVYMIPSISIWQWSGMWQWLMNSLGFGAILGFIWSLKYYDNMDFLGVSQISQKSSILSHQFTLSPLHRFVRHPWYFFGLVIIWSRDMNAHFLITTLCMTIYFIVGSIYEERKLVIEYGKTYVDFKKAVPGLFPSFRRYLTRVQANKLMNKNT